MIDWDDWNGDRLRAAVMGMDRSFPEHELALEPDGTPMPHDNPWHRESLLDHTCAVIDGGRGLSRRYRLSARDHAILMVACTWHDAGKPVVRSPKDRYICTSCGWPTARSDRGCACGGTMELRTVMGYHEHEKVSSGDWMFGNISRREGLPPDISGRARRIISDHRWLPDSIEAGKPVPRWITLPHVLMLWADDIGCDKAPFDTFDFEAVFSRIAGRFVR